MFEDNRNKVKGTLRQTQLVQLRMLRYVDKICKENGINYWLDGGTLLGAVRHKGFIPWDDDLDIAMLRKDYKKFLNIAQKELPKDIFLQNTETEKYYTRPFTRLRDKYSTYELEEWESTNNRIHSGIFIDIFPFDYLPKKNFFKKIQLYLYFLLRILKLEANPDKLKMKSIKNRKYKVAIIKLIVVIGKFVPKALYIKLYECINSFFYKISPSNEIGDGLVNPTYYFKSIRNINKIFPLKKLRFEDYEFQVPNDTDFYLKGLYGDYMELPSIEDRKNHAKNIKPFVHCSHKEVLYWEKGEE